MSICLHTRVIVWTLDEVGQLYDRETREWGEENGHETGRITGVFCDDCGVRLRLTKALRTEIRDHM